MYSPDSDFNSIQEIISIQQIEPGAACIEQIRNSRHYLDTALSKHGAVYGVNTGFGALHNIRIEQENMADLQENMVKSHACGTGDATPTQVVRLMLLLKIRSLAQGNSGISADTFLRLCHLFNANITPVVYDQGSLGASGDLVPLAHLSLPLLGLGEVWDGAKRIPAMAHPALRDLHPLKLQSKEGLALLNGTQFMCAYGVKICHEAGKMFQWAGALASLSLEAFGCRTEPFSEAIQNVRRHEGQKQVAASVRYWRENSPVANAPKDFVQDPYSFRCIPQVLGASLGVLHHVEEVFLNEANAVTDNPLIFPELDAIISGGNFHGQPLAMALDYLCIAMHEAGSIAERRINQLVSGKRGLPAFLSAQPGLHSGLMIPQYLAASIVSQNKQACTPASADSIDSSAGQEDHVSMGANAATKAWKVCSNLKTLLAIELFTAAQAMEFRRPAKSSPRLEQLLSDYREQVSFAPSDRVFATDIEQSRRFIESYSLPLE